MTKTCNNMSVILGNYSITIGGINDTIYTISKDGEEMFTTMKENTTGCDEYKQFWIRWDDNSVEVGEGSLGNVSGVAMWKDPIDSVVVTDIAVFSGSHGGSWIIPTPGIYCY